jgi:superfamily II DNA or RNA helicase
MTTLYKHQQEFLSQNPNKSALVWSCGTGKTRTAIEWGQYTQNTLIICPKALKANWHRECGKYFHQGIPWSVMILTKEEFRRDWSKLPAFESIVVDEVHNGFLTPGFKSQMSKALRSYTKKHNVPRVLLLSATVYTSSPWNIYNLAYLTGHVWDYMKFKYKFFMEMPLGVRTVWVPKKNVEAELAELTRRIASVVDMSECADIPEQTFEVEEFELTKEQQRAIKNAYDPLPIVRFTKQHEIENGVLKGNEFSEDMIFNCDKNDRIVELVEENPKIIIVCRYNLQIDRLKNLLWQYEPLVIRGDVKDRDTVVQKAEKREKCVVIIQAACSAGYELPSFPVMVFASMDYSWVNYTQICGRILRLNKLKKNLYIHLLGGEMDHAIYDAIKKKEDFDIELYAKNRN